MWSKYKSNFGFIAINQKKKENEGKYMVSGLGKETTSWAGIPHTLPHDSSLCLRGQGVSALVPLFSGKSLHHSANMEIGLPRLHNFSTQVAKFKEETLVYENFPYVENIIRSWEK